MPPVAESAGAWPASASAATVAGASAASVPVSGAPARTHASTARRLVKSVTVPGDGGPHGHGSGAVSRQGTDTARRPRASRAAQASAASRSSRVTSQVVLTQRGLAGFARSRYGPMTDL